MPLSGADFKELIEALLEAFPDRLDLAKMLWVGLEKHLNAIANTNSLEGDLFLLVQKADAQGWTERLVEAAKVANPGNERLQAFARTVKLERPTLPPQGELSNVGALPQASLSDYEALENLRNFLNRPAMWTPFHQQTNMPGLRQALDDISNALGTGTIKDRGGKEFSQGKPVDKFTTPTWKKTLKEIRKEFYQLKNSLELAIGTGKIKINAFGLPEINDFEFANEFVNEYNERKEKIIQLLNALFIEASFDPLDAIR